MHDNYYADQPLSIGNELHPLIDDALIEDRWNLPRVLAVPEKYLRNPVLMADEPWEGDGVQGATVLYDGGRYRMWYTADTNAAGQAVGMGRRVVSYAESKNGLHWTKPQLDVHTYAEFGKTNVVYGGSDGLSIGSHQVFIDQQESNPDQRYKMITLDKGVRLATSPDGLHWRRDEQAILDFHSDCYNNVVYDPFRHRWILYGRPNFWFTISGVRNSVRRSDGSMGNRHTRRKVFASTSTDLKQWSYPRTVMYPDERDFSDYDDCHVFRVGRTFVMLYSAMHDETGYANEVRLATSGDGLHWQRHHTREPFIPRGREGDWDAGMTYMTSEPVPRGDQALIYYTGAAKPQSQHSMMRGIGVTVTRPGRFVALQAGNEPGYVVTREFKLEGNRLRVNLLYHSQPFKDHYLRAEFVHRPDTPHGHGGFNPALEGFGLGDCDPVNWVDSHQALVKWNGNPDLSKITGQNVYLRFEVRNMSLFGFQITKE